MESGKLRSVRLRCRLPIELTQMFGLGITDVNDLMTTTAGACLGLFLYRAVWKRKNAEQKTKL